MSENIGLAPSDQRKKVKNDPKFSGQDILCTGKDGKSYKILCIPEDEVGAWLFSTNPNRVPNPITKEKLIKYQKNLVKAIHDFVTKGIAVNKEKTEVISLEEQLLMTAQVLVDQKKKIQKVEQVQEVHDEKISQLKNRIEVDYGAIPGELSILTPEEYSNSGEDSSTLRRRVTTLIQFIADRKKKPHDEVWTSSYENYNRLRRMNLQSRATNRRCRPIEVIENEGRLKDFYDLTYHYWKVPYYHNT